MTTKREPPRGPVKIDEVPWEEWGQGVRFATRARYLSDTTNTTARIGVAIEELSPGKQSCPLHYHLLEEEHVIVLEGEMTLRLGDEEHTLRAGDYCCFPAGRAEGHCFVNRGSAVCRYILVGDRNENEVCVYPESGKVLLRGFARRIFREGPALEYWDGERAEEPLT